MHAIDVSEWSFEGRFGDWTADARYFEYTKAVNPIGAGLTPRIPIRHYPAERSRAELARVAAAPRAANRNRISVLLANAEQPQSLTVTHVLWAMLGLLPAGQMQPPHRHQSVALDLVIDCPPEGCYTLVGNRLDDDGRIVDPTRVDWRQGAAFVTPPGLWHAHHNESGQDAHLIPVQDAGLHTYLRSLDIRFTTRVRMQIGG